MWVITKITSKQAKELRHGRGGETFILEIGKMTSEKAQESMNGGMEQFMMELGKTTREMELELS